MDGSMTMGPGGEAGAGSNQARIALIEEWSKRIQEAKTYWEERRFKKMRRDMRFARGDQWPDQAADDDRYIANVVQRQIAARTAAIFAKNPTAIARRRPRQDFAVWDESPVTLLHAKQAIEQSMAAGMPPPPEAMAVVQDVEQGARQRRLYDRMARTLEILFHYYLNEGVPRFKIQAKQLIRRVRTCSVGYVKLGFQRIMKPSPDTEAKILDISDRLAKMERLSHELQKNELQDNEAEMEELRLMLADLQAQPMMLLREGLVFDFPKATSIIIDPGCTQLRGFVGARWIAQEFLFTPEKVAEIYGRDIKCGCKDGQEGFTPHQINGKKARAGSAKSLAAVYEIYDMDSQLKLTICVGHKEFMEEPASPDVFLEQFHPFFALTFNDVEDEEDPYPPSDVEILRPMQMEINRAREAVREHRIGNRPAWVGAKGLFTETDKAKLGSHAAHEFLELDAIPATSDVDIKTKLQAKPVQPIDPATYETETVFTDILRTSGDQEANLGGTSNSTATESSIAENSRMSSIQSNTDDLDEFLTDLARASGQIMLLNLNEQTVKQIAGPGAVWPTMNRMEVAQEIQLEIVAGSSGRPNRAMKVQTMERLMPLAFQTPGFNPTWALKKLLREMDDDIDMTDAIIDGLPSIVAQNAMQKPNTGNPASEPTAQGGAGGAPPQPQTAPASAGASQPQTMGDNRAPGGKSALPGAAY